MAVESPINFATLDVEKELKRWEHVFQVLNEPEPKIGHTPRNEVWKKNKSVLWHYPTNQKEIWYSFILRLFFV